MLKLAPPAKQVSVDLLVLVLRDIICGRTGDHVYASELLGIRYPVCPHV